MAEESAKPPTITTPVGHMCTCEHPCVAGTACGCGQRRAAAGTLKMLASAALGMNAAGWQNAAWTARREMLAKQCWRDACEMLACECAGIDGRMKTIIPRPDVEPAPLSGWFFSFLFSFVRICFHLLFHYTGLFRLF